MRKLITRGMLTRKLRTALTAIAIMLGVAMISGTFVLTDQINGAFDKIFASSFRDIDAVVTPQKAYESEDETFNPTLRLDQSLIERVSAVEGVALAEGAFDGSAGIVKDGEYLGSTGGAPSFLTAITSNAENTAQITSGGFPEGSGQIAVDKKTADDNDIAVGQRVQVATTKGLADVTVAGVFDSEIDIGGASIILATLPDVQTWSDGEGKVSYIQAKADEGVSQAELKSRIAAELGDGVVVETAQESATRQAADINDSIGGFLTPALLAFAAVAVFVGAFIIFNTFTITVAQRIREFAMVRTLGAARGQVLRAVIGEALIVSVAASILGIAAGYLVAAGIGALFKAVGFGLPTADASLAARTVIIALVVGVGVTLVASLAPALKATRIAPIAALREGATLPPGRLSRFTPWFALVIAVLGALLIYNGLAGSGSLSNRMLGLGVGALLEFVAAGMTAKYVVPGIARVVGWPIERVSRRTGRLARENSTRNPSRTAVTAAALMIGVGLVVFVSVFASGIKASFFDALDRSVQGDFIIEANGGQSIPGAGAIEAVRSAEGVGVASPLRFADARVSIDGGQPGTEYFTAVEPDTYAQVFRTDWQQGGSDELLARLGEGGAIVEQDWADGKGLVEGDRFTLNGVSGRSAEFEVLGFYKDEQLNTTFVIADEGWQRISDSRDIGLMLVDAASGADLTQVEASVKEAMKQFPIATVKSNEKYKEDLSGQLDQIVYLLYALLAMSVIISLFGMVNTLVLSMFERTREIGMMRAIGLTRWQLRRMVGVESIITAVIGGVLGLAIGLIFGFVFTKALEDEGLAFAVPYGTLFAVLIVALIAGLLASIFPARRAARLRPLEALHYE